MTNDELTWEQEKAQLIKLRGMLYECSRSKDVTEWNTWREENPNAYIDFSPANYNDKIYLGGGTRIGGDGPWEEFPKKGLYLAYKNLEKINLSDVNLEEATLNQSNFKNANFTNAVLNGVELEAAQLQGVNLFEAHLNSSNLRGAHLEPSEDSESILMGTHLKNSDLRHADLRNAYLADSHFEGANLSRANLEKAKLENIHFESNLGKKTILFGANFNKTSLKRTNFEEANLESSSFKEANFGEVILRKANLKEANLEATKLRDSDLRGANFHYASLNNETTIRNCIIDDDTDFTGANLESARIEPSLLTRLQANIRRKSWQRYCEKLNNRGSWSRIQSFFIKTFWEVSDYGSSTMKIFKTILKSLIIFSLAYIVLLLIVPEALVVNSNPMPPISKRTFIVWLWQIFCFTISTMVTLGFGGINVNLSSDIISNHPVGVFIALTLVTLNLLFGYAMLAVLVTRIGILFQSLTAPEWDLDEGENKNHPK